MSTKIHPEISNYLKLSSQIRMARKALEDPRVKANPELARKINIETTALEIMLEERFFNR